MEFEYALSIGKPIISFLPKYPEKIPSGKSEQDADKKTKLEAFKELAKKKLIKYWESPENLGSVVSRSMVRLIKDFPAEGWIKASSAVDENSLKEIARLQKENVQLKEEIESFSTKAPVGSAELSQGNDRITINFNFAANKGLFDFLSLSSSLILSWNDIFACVAPHMIEECTEDDFRMSINEHIKKHSINSIDMKNLDEYQISHFEIQNDSFNVIKVQLRALGLISLSNKKRTASDKNTYWKLTPYGDYVMTQLLAIKKDDVK